MSDENNSTGGNFSLIMIVVGLFLIFQAPVSWRAGNGPGGWLVRIISGACVLGAEFFLICALFPKFHGLWQLSVVLMVGWVVMLGIACDMRRKRLASQPSDE